MNIALFPNMIKSPTRKIVQELAAFLSARGAVLYSEDAIAAEINVLPLSSVDISLIDLAISLGGDGTILRLVHRHPDLDAPIFGINAGSLGFMADIPIKEMHRGIEELLKGNYFVQERIMMEGVSPNGQKSLAVNEIVIHRAQNPCLVDLALSVDGSYLNTFSADGIIISTPSGSTAYSLAAGGPILTPELKAFVITPICPHTISNRPIVLMPQKEIRIEYISEHNPVEITYDGFPTDSIETGQMMHIRLSKKKFRLATLHNHDYFSTLRTKLGWTGKLKI